MSDIGPFIFIVLIFSIVVHECAHGYAALKAGDDTAKFSGRLTLNPIPHIDPIGSILVPAIMYMSGGGIFGWAKPVPVNPRNYGNPRVDNLKVSAAGPASNILLASVSTLICIILILFGIRINELIFKIFLSGIQINILLAVFNMIPLAPLDGSHILEYFIPYEMLEGYHKFQRAGSVILLILIMSGFIFGIPLLMMIIMPPFNFFYSIFVSVIEIFL